MQKILLKTFLLRRQGITPYKFPKIPLPQLFPKGTNISTFVIFFGYNSQSVHFMKKCSRQKIFFVRLSSIFVLIIFLSNLQKNKDRVLESAKGNSTSLSNYNHHDAQVMQGCVQLSL